MNTVVYTKYSKWIPWSILGILKEYPIWRALVCTMEGYTFSTLEHLWHYPNNKSITQNVKQNIHIYPPPPPPKEKACT